MSEPQLSQANAGYAYSVINIGGRFNCEGRQSICGENARASVTAGRRAAAPQAENLSRFTVKNVKVAVLDCRAYRVPELISVFCTCSQPAANVSHKPDGRLPLLSARPAVTLAILLLPVSLLSERWM